MTSLHNSLRRELNNEKNKYYLEAAPSHRAAFTIVEIVVAAAILALLAVGVAEILTVGINALKKNKIANSLESVVDKDLASIKDISYRFTCCPGQCTIDQATITAASTCSEKIAGKQNYYFPKPGSGLSDTTEITTFKSKCASGELITDLASTIEQSNPSNLLTDNVSRSIDTTQSLQHKLTITYGSDSFSKSYTISPTVAAWCV